MNANQHLYEAQRRDSFKHWPFADSKPCSIGKVITHKIREVIYPPPPKPID